MKQTLQQRMQEAMRMTLAGRLDEATQAIQRALSDASAGTSEPSSAAASSTEAAAEPRAASAPASTGAAADTDESMVLDAPSPADPGDFIKGSHTQSGLLRHYKLYVPPGSAGQHRPMVVMLHGCTQDADDFAAGTDMNERARAQGFFVLYPEQSKDANPSRCWNWFKHSHQQRGRGEPASIAGMTQSVADRYQIDQRRVYIAGLSAGGAMAVIVAAAYPEIFAAVGVHSGLPAGAASDVAGALALMNTGATGPGLPAGMGFAVKGRPPAGSPSSAVPTIAFHGAQDKVVHPRNGDQVIADILPPQSTPADRRVEHGVSPQGRRYTRVVHADVHGQDWAEHWLVHGAGHAWSGGKAQGSYTDASGPDATGEMLRFFFARRLPG